MDAQPWSHIVLTSAFTCWKRWTCENYLWLSFKWFNLFVFHLLFLMGEKTISLHLIAEENRRLFYVLYHKESFLEWLKRKFCYYFCRSFSVRKKKKRIKIAQQRFIDSIWNLNMRKKIFYLILDKTTGISKLKFPNWAEETAYTVLVKMT